MNGKRTNTKRKLLAILLSLAMLFSAVGFLSVSYAGPIEDAKGELSSLREQLASLKNQINSNKAEAKKLVAQITNLDKSISSVSASIAKLEAEINILKEKVSVAQTELADKEAEVANQDEQMGLRVRNMYKNSEMSIFQILLGSDSITDLMTNLDMATRIMNNDVALLGQLQSQYEMLRDYREQLEALTIQLEEEQTAQREQQDSLEHAREEVAAVKASLETNTKYLEAQEEAMEAEANALTAEILKLQTDAAYIGGTMVWPVPASTRITSKFGYRIHPVLKYNKLHTGIDIGVNSYSKIIAVNAGTVIKAAWNNSYGYMVMIDHGGGIVTLYAHNNELLVKTGDIVAQGQQIAWSGNTGMSTGPHSHVEVRLNGVYQDPLLDEYLGTFVD